MPDSLPFVRKPRSGNPALPIDSKAEEPRASANFAVLGALHLDMPPRDVSRLLERHGTSLPRYLDAQRWRDVAASRERWPLLWVRRPKLPEVAS